ncbi:dinuclear metal center protein, YbgI/SA1388 family [Bernardetia litoralis DSM 6794]|uniref:GTP cyclohydrolase 1 type 2 homolog n=1 Tax=Bernardetia litoralis (strain ATCC 23117 / DSM 6794 / NBRC 15988 / NCIMB 1366 / Fx l1 / Sio-4) TaxID=880071 RepID=I4AQT3_BERLS|nr:Nif3-like dinuclear metal center hexameric protein [Bernardetia litoralis]AFM06318.1 dinuclear metal center protein, YbgI/SA1388 family [Bernardetia litoralis DSM 6794]
MTYTFSQITSYLESIAPLNFQESYDNSGLLVGNPNTEITGVLVSLDTIESVIEEAKAKNCNLIVAHHPIIFKGLKSLTGKNYIERTVIKAIQEGIGIYAIHTNLDNIKDGVNAKISEKIGLINTKILSPKNNTFHKDTNDEPQKVGSGMIGELSEAISATAFLANLKSKMNLPLIKHTCLENFKDQKIKKIALCGGAGSFLLQEAIKQKADFFITGDYKYHEFFDAEDKIVICDIGHYESEVFTKDLLVDFLKNQFSELEIIACQTNTNPVEYYF